MQPSPVCLDGMRSFTVLNLHNGMIMTTIDNLFFFNLCMSDVFDKCPTDTSARTCINKSILRTGIESILAINKFGMENHIALLTLCFQVGQTIPVNEIFGTGNCRSGSGGRQIIRVIVIMTFGTEHTVNPSVFMLSKTHVIDIGSRNNIFRHRYRFIPKTKIIYTVRTLSYRKERFTVSPLNTNHKHILISPFDCT